MFESPINLLFDPFFTFRLVSFDIDIVDQRSKIPHFFDVIKQLTNIILGLLLIWILRFQSLFIKVTQSIHAQFYIIEIQKCPRIIIHCELD